MKPKTNTIVRRSMKEAFDEGRHNAVQWAWDFLGLDLHEGQQKFVIESTRPGIKEGNLSAGNRYGKSDVASVKLLHSAFYQTRNEQFAYDALGNLRPYTAINVSISLDQASIVFNKAVGYAQGSKKLAPFIDRVVNSPFPELRFKPVKGARQGAEVWARSTANGARYLLGQRFEYLGWDEAALEPNGEEILGNVIRMRMADSGGNIDTFTQPRGKNWQYYHFLRGLKDSGVYDPSCYSQYGCSFENPHIDHDFVRRSMEFMTEGQIQENIYGKHADFDALFPADQIAALYANQDYRLPIPVGHDILWKTQGGATYAQFVANPKAHPVYVMGVDLAAVIDQTCIVVLRIDVAPWQMVAFELMPTSIPWQRVKDKITELHKQYGAWGLVDSTGAGGPILEDLQLAYGCDVEGYNFGGSTGPKLDLLYELQLAVQNREFVFPYYGETEQRGTRPLVSQLTHYQYSDKKLATDAVFGTALAVKAARTWIERSRIPPVETPDLAAVVVHVDPQTGLPLVFRADDFDDEYDPEDERQLARRYRHLAALI